MKSALGNLLEQSIIALMLLERLDPESFTVTKRELRKAIKEAQINEKRYFMFYEGVERGKKKR
jgi:hypothetical protein